MSKFKPGDRVKCIRSNPRLIAGRIYIIEDYTSEYVWLKEERGPYFTNRFELVKEKKAYHPEWL